LRPTSLTRRPEEVPAETPRPATFTQQPPCIGAVRRASRASAEPRATAIRGSGLGPERRTWCVRTSTRPQSPRRAQTERKWRHRPAVQRPGVAVFAGRSWAVTSECESLKIVVSPVRVRVSPSTEGLQTALLYRTKVPGGAPTRHGGAQSPKRSPNGPRRRNCGLRVTDSAMRSGNRTRAVQTYTVDHGNLSPGTVTISPRSCRRSLTGVTTVTGRPHCSARRGRP
jgi:hypothetical protein